jgi:archaemetzincin
MAISITLVPIGPVSPALLSWLVDRLAEVTRRDVVVGEMVPLPVAGYDRRRQQYRASAFIAVLRVLHCPAAERVVGLTEVDCYASGLNFIFGQAMMGGREAFVALPRLRESFYGLPEDTILFRERVLKEVVHELGHTWGLSHCADPHCVMHFSNSLHDTDAKGKDFCPGCQARIGGTGQAR